MALLASLRAEAEQRDEAHRAKVKQEMKQETEQAERRKKWAAAGKKMTMAVWEVDVLRRGWEAESRGFMGGDVEEISGWCGGEACRESNVLPKK